MKEIKLTCEVITPMFMSGADGTTPELRPSEFKGMMRFWYRALRAEDLKNLRKEESDIFGGAGEGEGKSKVKIKLQPEHTSKGNNVENAIKNYSGIKYFYYSTYALKKSKRNYFGPGSRFSIELSSYNEYAFKVACSSLWVSIYLGGFGTRARRGGGNITITEPEEVEFDGESLSFVPNVTNKSELKRWYEENLKKIKQVIKRGRNYNGEYPTLSNVIVFDGKNDWKEALNFLGEIYKGFRKENRKRNYELGVLGMPIVYRNGKKAVPYKNPKEKLSERFSSPVIFKVVKSQNLYFPVVVVLNSKIDYIKLEGTKEEPKKANFDIIEKFLGKLKSEGGEVIDYGQL